MEGKKEMGLLGDLWNTVWSTEKLNREKIKQHTNENCDAKRTEIAGLVGDLQSIVFNELNREKLFI